MNLKQELEKIHGRKLYDDAVALITLDYRLKNGIKGRITKECDKQAIIDIERAKIAKQSDLIEVPAQKKKPCYSKQYDYKTITLFTRNENVKTRHVIKLEQFYIDALESIGIDKKAAWLSEAIAVEFNETTGDKSIAKMVKSAIVFELVRRATGGKK